ncbi:unnamed protein product [Ectocarpus sp. 4 AP-2014]
MLPLLLLFVSLHPCPETAPCLSPHRGAACAYVARQTTAQTVALCASGPSSVLCALPSASLRPPRSILEVVSVISLTLSLSLRRWRDGFRCVLFDRDVLLTRLFCLFATHASSSTSATSECDMYILHGCCAILTHRPRIEKVAVGTARAKYYLLRASLRLQFGA